MSFSYGGPGHITPEFLKGILEKSDRNNSRDQITGFLAERAGYFLQLLEGPEALVRACYARVQSDPRHSQIVLQGEAMADQRLMPNWGHGYVEIAEGKGATEDLLTLFDLGRAGKMYSSPKSLHFILKQFAKDAKILKP